ncbi:hypothetical protein [Pseudomonas putida]|uniref:hypothetical protein n=1 Tax=Pseudomonas putida TaxID=303 RepID=UPI001E43D423|nr:hypothetical protein [Pseudomonas putida]
MRHETHHDVIRVAHHDHIATGMPLVPLPCAQIRHKMQIDTCHRNGEINAPWGVPLVGQILHVVEVITGMTLKITAASKE